MKPLVERRMRNVILEPRPRILQRAENQNEYRPGATCACITEETSEVIIIFPTLWKRMGLADTLTGRSQMFHASLRLRLRAYSCARTCLYSRFPNSKSFCVPQHGALHTRRIPLPNETALRFDFGSFVVEILQKQNKRVTRTRKYVEKDDTISDDWCTKKKKRW